MKRTIARLELNRAEGGEQTALFESVEGQSNTQLLQLADEKLSTWSITAPGPGQGYHKVDVRLILENGETLGLRYDLTRQNRTFLMDALTNHLRLMGGLLTPAELESYGFSNREAYIEFLNGWHQGPRYSRQVWVRNKEILESL